MRREMKKTKYKLDTYEIKLIIGAFVEWRNQLLSEGKNTDAIDDLLLKLLE